MQKRRALHWNIITESLHLVSKYRQDLTQLPLKPPSVRAVVITRWHGTSGAYGFLRRACRHHNSAVAATQANYFMVSATSSKGTCDCMHMFCVMAMA